MIRGVEPPGWPSAPSPPSEGAEADAGPPSEDRHSANPGDLASSSQGPGLTERQEYEIPEEDHEVVQEAF